MRYESELGTAQYRGQLLVVHEMPMQDSFPLLSTWVWECD